MMTDWVMSGTLVCRLVAWTKLNCHTIGVTIEKPLPAITTN